MKLKDPKAHVVTCETPCRHQVSSRSNRGPLAATMPTLCQVLKAEIAPSNLKRKVVWLCSY